MNKIIIGFVCIAFAIGFSTCELEEEPTPTDDLMYGVWELTEAYDTSGNSIYDTITTWNFPIYMDLFNTEGFESTAGPLFMYIIYGKSKFINVVSTFDDLFMYANLTPTGGEWFIDKNKVVDVFTIKVRMLFPSMQTFTTVFDLLNLQQPEVLADAQEIVVHHKFKFVSVDVTDDNPDQMIWEFTNNVETRYYTYDAQGEENTFTLINVPFQKCRLVFTKKVKSLRELMEEAANNK
ncbi:MAG: hypothetical protein ACOC3T_02895 [Bacteroidota bacterium]